MTRVFLASSLILSSALLPAIPASGRHAARTPAGTYAKAPVTIDGDDSEWPSPYPYYDSKAKISYAIANDSATLYLTLKASERLIQQKLIRGGLKVWLDPTGKKEEVFGINYPEKQATAPPADAADNSHEAREEDGRPLQRDSLHRHHPPMLMPVDVALSDFPTCTGNFTVNGSNPCGIRISMGRNDYNELVWEAAVPLSLTYPQGSATGQPLAVCFEIGGMTLPARGMGRGAESGGGGGHHGGGHSGGGMGGGGMGMGGMGMGGGRGHQQGESGMGDFDPEILTQTTRTWTKTGIAAQ